MRLKPREAAFLLDEMAEIERADNRLPSEQKEAERIRRKAEATLTE